MHNIKEYSEQEVAHTKCLNLFQGLITKKKFKEIEMINQNKKNCLDCLDLDNIKYK